MLAERTFWVCLALCASVHAEEHFRGLSYEPPKHWTLEQSADEMRRYHAPGLAPGEECRIDFIGPVPLRTRSGERVVAKELFADLQPPLATVLHSTGVVTSKTLSGAPLLVEEQLLGDHLWRGYYAVVQHGQMAMVLLEASSRRLFVAHRGDASAIVHSLQISPPSGLTLRRTDVHAAMRLFAKSHSLSVIVVGGGSVEATLDVTDPEAALARLAQAAGLAVARRGKFHLLAPPKIITALPADVTFKGGRRADLDFLHANVPDLLHLLADVDRRKLDSHLTGEASLMLDNVPIREVVGWLAALGHATLATPNDALSIGPGTLAKGAMFEIMCRRPPDLPAARLGCMPNDQIELVGVDWPWALVQGRTADGLHTDVVRAGERLGLSGLTVTGVDADALELEDGGELRLSPAPR